MQDPSDPAEQPSGLETAAEFAPLPKNVGRYCIERQLGQGAFANVYLARAPEAFRPVALKVLRDALDPRIEAQARVRFLAEERIANAIDDERVVRILEASAVGERPCYLAMEYVDGEPFTAAVSRKLKLEGGRTSSFWHYVARLGYEVAQAMSRAHSRGIVHRDLKPDNVLVARRAARLPGGRDLGPSLSIKIVDFGIAKAKSELFNGIEAPLLTRHFTVLGTVMGSPPYMAPEQNGAAHAVTGKADVYALGVLLTVAALDLDPEAIELGELGLRAALDLRGPLSEAGLPPSFCGLLSSMVALEPEERPSMREVAMELGRRSQQDIELARAVHQWLTRSKLPEGKALAKISRRAPAPHLCTDDEREFLLTAPLERLERPKGRGLRAMGVVSLLGSSVALGWFAYREHRAANELSARVHVTAADSERARTLANDLSQAAEQKQALIARASLQEARLDDLDRDRVLLAKNVRDSEGRLAECRSSEQHLSECTAQRSALEERHKRADQEFQTTRRELETCQKRLDQNEDAAQVCRRELDARSQELSESSSRIRLCMESLRARHVEPSTDPPGDG